MDTLAAIDGVHGLRDWFYVIGLLGFGLTTMAPVFYLLWKWGPDVGEEASRERTWLTPPLDEKFGKSKEEEINDELVTVGQRVHSQLPTVHGMAVR